MPTGKVIFLWGFLKPEMFQPTGAHLDLSNFQLLSVRSFSYNIAVGRTLKSEVYRSCLCVSIKKKNYIVK